MIIVWLKNTIYQENYPYTCMLPLKLEYFPIRLSEEKKQYILLFKFGDVPIVWFRTLLSKEIKKSLKMHGHDHRASLIFCLVFRLVKIEHNKTRGPGVLCVYI